MWHGLQSLGAHGTSNPTTVSSSLFNTTNCAVDGSRVDRELEASGGSDAHAPKVSCMNPNMTFVLPSGLSLAGKGEGDGQEEAHIDMNTVDNHKMKGGDNFENEGTTDMRRARVPTHVVRSVVSVYNCVWVSRVQH